MILKPIRSRGLSHCGSSSPPIRSSSMKSVPRTRSSHRTQSNSAMRFLALVVIAFGLRGTVSPAPRQAPPAVRPPLLFREDWRLPRHEGAATDENTRFKPEVVTNERLEAKLYGTGSAPVRAAEHEGRIDLWTGLATSPVALTLRDKRNYFDLT